MKYCNAVICGYFAVMVEVLDEIFVYFIVSFIVFAYCIQREWEKPALYNNRLYRKNLLLVYYTILLIYIFLWWFLQLSP